MLRKYALRGLAPRFWVRHFATVAELIDALRQFKERYNEQWLIARHGYRTPAQVRRAMKGVSPAVA